MSSCCMTKTTYKSSLGAWVIKASAQACRRVLMGIIWITTPEYYWAPWKVGRLERQNAHTFVLRVGEGGLVERVD